MIRTEFTMLLTKLCTFYERKMPITGTVDLWFDAVKDIKESEIDYIFTRVTKENDSFPRNIAGLMWALHYEHVESTRDSTDATHYKHCPDCNGEGLLFLQKPFKNAGDYRYVFRCDQCKQSKVQAYPWGNKWILLKKGYEEIPDRIGRVQIRNQRELKKAVDEIGKAL